MKMPKPRAKYDPRKQGAKFRQMELNNFGSVYCSVSFLQSPGYVQTPRGNLERAASVKIKWKIKCS